MFHNPIDKFLEFDNRSRWCAPEVVEDIRTYFYLHFANKWCKKLNFAQLEKLNCREKNQQINMFVQPSAFQKTDALKIINKRKLNPRFSAERADAIPKLMLISQKFSKNNTLYLTGSK